MSDIKTTSSNFSIAIGETIILGIYCAEENQFYPNLYVELFILFIIILFYY